MLDYRDALKDELKDPKFKKAWEDFSLEYNLASLVMRLRNEAGLSQAELAKKVGTTQSAIARIEGGKVIPRIDTLTKIARACGKKLKIDVH
jgi:ribosome-binding protein aMBF1 (putative translation factor)